MKKYTFIVLILIVAFFLRFYQLGENPPSLTWDEAAWGYNAYSLGTDGKDEFGRFLPLDYIESFGDFKPPVYAYLDVIPVKILGLSEFAVRFPSALFGVLTVLIAYFLVKTLFHLRGVHPRFAKASRGESATSEVSKAENIALLSAFLLAVSPWHIMLSRAAFEANVATFFIVLGVFLFLSAVNSVKSRGAVSSPPQGWKPIDTPGLGFLLLISFSVISFILSIYTFNTARVVAPILILVLAFGFRKELLKQKKETLLAIVLGIVLLLPVANFLTSPQASLRFREVNIFSDIGVIENANQQIENDDNAWWSKIIHNRRLIYGVSYLRHYLDNLNPDFLFIKGDGNPKFSTQTVGQMYLWELPFFIIGILYLIKRKEGYWWIVPTWLLIGIIPAGLARETPHALRIENSLPTFQIFTAYGIFFVTQRISNFKFQILNLKLWKLFAICYLLFAISNFLYFFHDYLAHYPRMYSGEWQYGYKDSIEYVQSVQDNYSKIYATSDLGRPYIYYLFYTKTDPRLFRKNNVVKRDVFGFVNIERFGKYDFLNKKKKADNKNDKALFVQTPLNVPAKSKILKKFYLLNNSESLVAYE